VFSELAMSVHDSQRDQRLALVLQPGQVEGDGSSVPIKSDYGNRFNRNWNCQTNPHSYNQLLGNKKI
jgi:hypothetical protein